LSMQKIITFRERNEGKIETNKIIFSPRNRVEIDRNITII